jgi:hypothetical protein
MVLRVVGFGCWVYSLITCVSITCLCFVVLETVEPSRRCWFLLLVAYFSTVLKQNRCFFIT